MKSKFKTTTLIAAIGMIAYTLYVLVRYAIHEFCTLYPYRFNLWDDKAYIEMGEYLKKHFDK